MVVHWDCHCWLSSNHGLWVVGIHLLILYRISIARHLADLHSTTFLGSHDTVVCFFDDVTGDVTQSATSFLHILHTTVWGQVSLSRSIVVEVFRSLVVIVHVPIDTSHAFVESEAGILYRLLVIVCHSCRRCVARGAHSFYPQVLWCSTRLLNLLAVVLVGEAATNGASAGLSFLRGLAVLHWIAGFRCLRQKRQRWMIVMKKVTNSQHQTDRLIIW